MIPVRVPADLKVVFTSDKILVLTSEHPLYAEPCPVCDIDLGAAPCCLVFVGIAPEDRKDAGWTTGGAVAVHAACAGAAG